MTRKTEPIQFAGSELGENRHARVFVDGEEEAYRVLLAFISDGFACGDRAVHLVNPCQCCNHPQRLASAADRSPIDDLIEFESPVNDVSRHEDAVISA